MIMTRRMSSGSSTGRSHGDTPQSPYAQDTAELPVKALVFRHSLPREALAFVGGRVTRRAYTTRAAPTGFRDVPQPTPPSAALVLCNTTRSGLCGSGAPEIFLYGAPHKP